MNRFVDETVIEISSGHGGAGAVHFHREKSVPRGGPDGGDGGDGGDSVFVVRENLKTLSYLKMHKIFRAENGRPGRGQRKNGRKGRDVEIPVPPGTLIKESPSGEIIKDLTAEEKSWVFLKGGKGGKGNWHYRSSTKQAPRFAQPGIPGKIQKISLELNLIADIGMVGQPNAGKSTLLSVLTNAHPKIGSYPFTTKIPNIGVMKYYNQDIICADIPGIIEGSSKGVGLGLQFLKHINRTRVLAFMIDLSDSSSDHTFEILMKEIESFSPDLLEKPRILIGTKMDKIDSENAKAQLNLLILHNPSEKVLGISALTGIGIGELKRVLEELTIKHS